MTRPGEDLQRLVRIIEGATHDDGSVLVESPKRLPDKDTGRLREHDVVLTFTQRHHKLIVALECRDRSRKVGVPDVEAFYAKCERTGIDRGIMVSSTGFAQTALEKAASYNIGCLSLDHAEHLDWCLAPAIEVSHRRLIHVRLGAGAERQVGAGAKLYANNGTLIGPDEIRSIGLKCLKDPSAPTNGPVTQRFVDRAPAFHVVDENGERVALRTLTVDVTYEVTARLSPFEFREYVDRAEGKQLYTMALAKSTVPVSRATSLSSMRGSEEVRSCLYLRGAEPPKDTTRLHGFRKSWHWRARRAPARERRQGAPLAPGRPERRSRVLRRPE